MKQQQDNGYPIPHSQLKHDGQSQGPGGGVGGSAAGGTVGKQNITIEDALAYLGELKVAFKDEIHKYNTFLAVMGDFKANRIDTLGVMRRVKDILKGHPNLIVKFNTMLPEGCEITLDEEEAKPKYNEAISLVTQIKTRFVDDVDKYNSFLDILNMYKTEREDINYVTREVSKLLENHPDLLDGFLRFIPNWFGRASVVNTTVAQPHCDMDMPDAPHDEEEANPKPNDGV